MTENNLSKTTNKNTLKTFSKYKCLDWILSRGKNSIFTRRQLKDMLETVSEKYIEKSSEHVLRLNHLQEQNSLLKQQNIELRHGLAIFHQDLLAILDAQRHSQHQLFKQNEYDMNSHIQIQIELIKKIHSSNALAQHLLDTLKLNE